MEESVCAMIGCWESRKQWDGFLDVWGEITRLRNDGVHGYYVTEQSLRKLERCLVRLDTEEVFSQFVRLKEEFRGSREVHVPDKNLMDAIRQDLKVDCRWPVTERHMRELGGRRAKFAAGSKGIRELDGIEEAKQLKVLLLCGNVIESIDPLKSLKCLQTLELSSNGICDLSPLRALTELKHVKLAHNKISDIGALLELRHLTLVDLSGNTLAETEGGLKQLAQLREGGVKVVLNETASRVRGLDLVQFWDAVRAIGGRAGRVLR